MGHPGATLRGGSEGRLYLDTKQITSDRASGAREEGAEGVEKAGPSATEVVEGVRE